MNEFDFKRFCWSYRMKIGGQINIMMESLLENPDFRKEMFSEKNNIVDLDLMLSMEYIFICCLYKHLRPKNKNKNKKIITLIEKILRCHSGLVKKEDREKDTDIEKIH